MLSPGWAESFRQMTVDGRKSSSLCSAESNVLFFGYSNPIINIRKSQPNWQFRRSCTATVHNSGQVPRLVSYIYLYILKERINNFFFLKRLTFCWIMWAAGKHILSRFIHCAETFCSVASRSTLGNRHASPTLGDELLASTTFTNRLPSFPLQLRLHFLRCLNPDSAGPILSLLLSVYKHERHADVQISHGPDGACTDDQ